MIDSVTAKNFLSIGSTPIHVNLIDGITLIVGENGCGKSTIYEAIFFGLFGVAFRDAKKASLVNDRTERGLEVVIAAGKYTITRTMSDVFVDEDGKRWPAQTLRETQERIERDIIRCNEQYVRQTMILGSSLHVPLFKLGALDRRRVLETVVNLGGIEQVEKYAAKLASASKKALEANKTTSASLASRIAAIKRADAFNASISARQRELIEQIEAIVLVPCTELESSSTPHAIADSTANIRAAKSDLIRIHTYLKTLDHGACNACQQSISAEFVKVKKSELANEIKSLLATVKEQEAILADAQEFHARYMESVNAYTKFQGFARDKRELELRLSELRLVEVDSISLADAEQKFSSLSESEFKLTEELAAANKVLTSIRDGSVREIVMKSVVQKIQNSAQKFLEVMGFTGKLTLDTTGKETIHHHSKERAYGLHSAGQQKRLDLAIMLSMRDYSIKHGGPTLGLLILDEIADTSLDFDGLNGLLSCLDDDPQSVVIISHHPGSLEESANRILTVTLDEQKFTTIKES